jgi:uncharacterized protein (TIGR03437 family)
MRLFIFVTSLYFCALPAEASTPAIAYSTYLRDNYTPTAIATDSSGNVYLAGNLLIDPSFNQTTILVLKLDPTGKQYLFTRVIGGSVNDYAYAMTLDTSGNIFIAGVTTSPDFPVVPGSNLATPPTTSTERSFVAKLNSAGEIVFSTLLGGSTNSYAQAVAVTGSGQVLVSGTSVAAGFPSTPGANSVTNTAFVPYLLEIDPTGTKLIFSATGIGGNVIALDSTGNIYVSGTTYSLTYPTTPGSYQPQFPAFLTCTAPCSGSSQGPNQYVTKLDPTGTKMIFSTAVSGSGKTLNTGLAVDSAGNVYLTGIAGASYPYTVTPPDAPLGPAANALATPAVPFLTKLDPNGQKLIYSVPVGGVTVQVDSKGNAYVAGILGQYAGYDIDAAIPALANIPTGCFQPAVASINSLYAAQVDPTGNMLGSQFIGGTSVAPTGVALSGSKLWISGSTSLSDFPFTPGSLTTSFFHVARQPGAYLGAVDFGAATPTAGTPQVGCVLDAANMLPTGPIVPFQLLTILGSGLGPAAGVAAPDTATTSLGGVAISVNDQPATLLYVSANQINMAVPLGIIGPFGATMQITVNGVPAAPLQYTTSNEHPSLYAVPGSYQSNQQLFASVARNADGSLNSPANPAPLGSVIAVYVNGLSLDPRVSLVPHTLYDAGNFPLVSYEALNPFVLQVDLRTPQTTANLGCTQTSCAAAFSVFDLSTYIAGGSPFGTGGLGFTGFVYVAPK